MRSKKILLAFLSCESGAAAIEYGLISALIGLSIIGGATAVGVNLQAKFSFIGNEVNRAGSPPTAGDSG